MMLLPCSVGFNTFDSKPTQMTRQAELHDNITVHYKKKQISAIV